jgi:hypothetical protein
MKIINDIFTKSYHKRVNKALISFPTMLRSYDSDRIKYDNQPIVSSSLVFRVKEYFKLSSAFQYFTLKGKQIITEEEFYKITNAFAIHCTKTLNLSDEEDRAYYCNDEAGCGGTFISSKSTLNGVVSRLMPSTLISPKNGTYLHILTPRYYDGRLYYSIEKL